MVVAEAEGRVKGRLSNPCADPPLRPDGKLDVAAAIGAGVLAVVRSRKGGGDPYTGLTEIVSGEIAADLAHYLATSEQINCALALGVQLDREGKVTVAGGFLVQPLPLCSDAALAALERNVAALPSVSAALASGAGATGVADLLLAGLGSAGDPFTLEPRYGPCDAEGLRGRMLRAAALLGEEEVRASLTAGGVLEMTCEFCRETLEFDGGEALDAARAARQG